MALWEYKVITSGKGGFASATMLESYLNQLGKDEWEIIDFRTESTNALAFNGLARRPTQREWTLEAAVAAAAKAEADKLRAELMHKQHAGDAVAASDAPAGSTAGDKAAGPDSLRQLRDTDRDHDPEALADEASHGADDWSNLDSYEDDLPTFFDAIKPHLRKNQNTPGQSVALNYLAKRWEQPEPDLYGALKECGFTIPEAETDAPVFVEFEGDLYWVEKNNRGQFFLNTREKPRPKFRIVPGKPLDPSDPVYVALAEEQAAAEAERAKRAAEQAAREAEAQAKRAEREAQRQAAEQARREQQAAAQAAREAAQAAREAARSAAANAASASVGAGEISPAPSAEVGESIPADSTSASAAPSAGEAVAPVKAAAPAPTGGTLPAGEALLDAIRPQMRRNRRGPGYSGSSAYLAKFFKVEEAVLRAALAELGLAANETPGGKAEDKVIGAYVYWVNKDGNGGLWINGREATAKDRAGGARPSTEAPVAASSESLSSPASTEPTVAAATVAPAATADGEPPIFRAVPRAMPPIPVAEPVVEESAPAPAPVAAPAETEVAPAAAPAVTEAAPALVLESETAPVAKPAKASSGRKPRGKSAAAAGSESDAEAGSASDAEASVDAPKPAKAASKPRTKRRASAAIDADAAAEE